MNIFVMRNQYTLDTDKLVFEPKKTTLKQVLKTLSKYLVLGVMFGLALWIVTLSGIVSSPKKIIIESSNAKLISEVVELNVKFDTISSFIKEIQNRDDNFYRVISKINPIPPSIRQAGFGGTDKYNNLEGFFSSSLLIKASKKSDILLNQLHIQSKSYDTIINLAKNLDDSLLSAPGIAPIAPNDYITISSKFGLRVHPITGKLQGHEGVDFAGDIGKPVHCTGDGIVTSVEKNAAGYGNRVIINHGYGFNTLYAHLSKILVKEGDILKRGQVIGKIGNTGSSTGPHLHYEVIVRGAKKNPINYYIDDLSDAEYLEMTQLFTSSN